MCRIYASLGAEGPPASELRAFRGQCATGCGGPHGDGWGVVGFREHGRPHNLGRSTIGADGDPGFEGAAARAAEFPVVLAHLRKASVGAKVPELTQPFTMGPWAFVHNGTIPDPYAARMGGSAPAMNDSRALFLRIEGRLSRAEPLAAIREALREVRDGGFPYDSATVLLTDGATMWAAREARRNLEEFTFRWTRREGRLVLAQDPVGDGDWAEVPNGHVAVLNGRDGGRVRVEPLWP